MDLNSFKHKVLPLKNKLYRQAIWMLKEPGEAEDAVQEVFIKLWKMKEKLSAYNSIEALAFRVNKNHCLDKIKFSKSEKEDINNYPNLDNQQASPYQITESKNNLKTVETIIANLPEQQKIILQLRNVEGYSIKEIAKVTGLKHNTVEMNLSRARKKVREQYKKIQEL